MDREQGIAEIDSVQWRGGESTVDLFVHNPSGSKVYCWLQLRPGYCDRGHIQFNVEGIPDIDGADMFPRYFFTVEEADTHVRTFLKWRLWKEGNHPRSLEGLLTQLDRVPVS